VAEDLAQPFNIAAVAQVDWLQTCGGTCAREPGSRPSGRVGGACGRTKFPGPDHRQSKGVGGPCLTQAGSG
jgi:hypothetical protein